MASIIRVTTTELRKKAQELRELNSKFKNEVAGLGDSEQTLSTMWEGEAQKVFRGEFQKDKAKFDAFYNGIEQYVQRLNETADRYDRAESENVSTASTRKA
ncbi:MAG: WXG100 family type VII secretion target [Lachnospiraceae bacterium]|nr:WXG100 family type VII secretion target [Lachnospiraceae bacterium]